MPKVNAETANEKTTKKAKRGPKPGRKAGRKAKKMKRAAKKLTGAKAAKQLVRLLNRAEATEKKLNAMRKEIKKLSRKF